jgi:hypothetical protein
MMDVEILPEVARWRSRSVRYFRGRWERLRLMVPKFELVNFAAGEREPVNPYLRTVFAPPD